jgi:hypothetical protein
MPRPVGWRDTLPLWSADEAASFRFAPVITFCPSVREAATTLEWGPNNLLVTARPAAEQSVGLLRIPKVTSALTRRKVDQTKTQKWHFTPS